jgi:hypothetical protein
MHGRERVSGVCWHEQRMDSHRVSCRTLLCYHFIPFHYHSTIPLPNHRPVRRLITVLARSAFVRASHSLHLCLQYVPFATSSFCHLLIPSRPLHSLPSRVALCASYTRCCRMHRVQMRAISSVFASLLHSVFVTLTVSFFTGCIS